METKLITPQDITGLIFLDCWNNLELKHWLNLVDQQLDQFTNIKTTVIANYNVSLNTDKDIGLWNTLRQWSGKRHSTDILLPLVTYPGDCKHGEIVAKRYNKDVYAILDTAGFVIHTKALYPDVKDWLVVGSTWKICTHHRPMGFVHLSKLPEYNFYITPWSMFKEFNTYFRGSLVEVDRSSRRLTDADIKQDSLNWQKIDNFGWKLQSD